MMQDAIRDFPRQFAYQPVIENARQLKKKKQFIVVGMGGSHLAADLVAAYNPALTLLVRRDYGLPPISTADLQRSLIVASSYSGNTEEVIEAYAQARKKKLSLLVIAVGGKLIALAKKDRVPYIQLPDTGIQPRSALGFSLLAHLKAFGMERELGQLRRLKSLDIAKTERQGKQLAGALKNHVAIIYSSAQNETIAWNWKIKLNETGKVPAFYNVFPELNHNEMTGFDVQPSSKQLSTLFHCIILADKKDHPQIQKRMQVVEKLYQDRGLPVTRFDLSEKKYFERVFTSLLIADWTAVHTATLYGLESEQVPMVEEFKRLITR